MVIATDRVARRFEDIVASVPIPVDFPLYETTDVRVFYGLDGLEAVPVTDYTIALDIVNFDTFTVTPTASLIAKIDALIVLDAAEENYIVVRRELDYLTDATPSVVRDLAFTSREFDRTSMRLLQLSEAQKRAVTLGPQFLAGAQPLRLDTLTPNRALVVDALGEAIVAGPTTDAIEGAQADALAAEAAKVAAQAAQAAAETFNPALFARKTVPETIEADWAFAPGVDLSFSDTSLFRTDTFRLKAFDGVESLIEADKNGAVRLFFDNATRLQTLIGGVDITGQLSVEKLLLSGLIDVTGGDMNAMVDGGFYLVSNTTLNRPDASTDKWYCLVMRESANTLVQVAFRQTLTGSYIAIRQRVGGVWDALWQTIGHREARATASVPSGGFFDIDGATIPRTANEINIQFYNISATVSAELGLRLLDPAVITAGYTGARAFNLAATSGAAYATTDRFDLALLQNAADTYSGEVTLRRVANTNRWNIRSTGQSLGAPLAQWTTRGHVDLGANQIAGFRLLLSAGTFDGGGEFYTDWRT